MKGLLDTDRAQALVASGSITRESACGSKQANTSRNDARHAAKAVGRAKDRRFETYRCPFCTHYHITRRRHGDDE